jgi:hypothetical protein
MNGRADKVLSKARADMTDEEKAALRKEYHAALREDAIQALVNITEAGLTLIIVAEEATIRDANGVAVSRCGWIGGRPTGWGILANVLHAADLANIPRGDKRLN